MRDVGVRADALEMQDAQHSFPTTQRGDDQGSRVGALAGARGPADGR